MPRKSVRKNRPSTKGRRKKAYYKKSRYSRGKAVKARRAYTTTGQARIDKRIAEPAVAQAMFPAKKRMKFVMDFPLSIGPVSSAYTNGYHIFRPNNLLEPVDGHVGQPAGWDQWSVYYRDYDISGVKVDVEGFCNAVHAPGAGPWYIFMYTDLVGNTTAPNNVATWADVVLMPNFTFLPLEGLRSGKYTGMSRYFPLKKLFPELADPSTSVRTIGTDYETNPETVNIYVGLFNMAVVPNSNVSLQARVRLTFYTELSNPKKISPS